MPQFLSTDEIRRRWIEFFTNLEHLHVPSASLKPRDDPSVLFTGAGMNQFKEHFMGRARLEHTRQRAVTVQKCLRAGDIENVGRTPSHHTFFEMLGNFSFGDYFKREAIEWAWQFCTDFKRGLGLEKERLSVTIFGGDPALGIEKDSEAEACWMQSAPELENKDGTWRIHPYGEHDNFWPAGAPSLGPNGPCGPCSEIYYDMKPEQGAPEPVAGSKDPQRYVEIWNLVFTQFNRVGGEGADAARLEPLAQKNIDTGAGLERMARVVQGKASNFEIELLFPIVFEAARVSRKMYGKDFETDRRMRRITDHARAAVFCIADGISPRNDGANYVVRRLLRRAILDGRELGITEPFMGKVAAAAIERMSAGYPDLTPRAETLVRTIEEEEKAFSETIQQGAQILDNQLMGQAWHRIIEDPNSPLSKCLSLFNKTHARLNVSIRREDSGMLRIIMAGPAGGDASATTGKQVELAAGGQSAPQFEVLIDEWKNENHKLRVCGEALALHGGVAFVLWDRFGFPYELTAETCAAIGATVDQAEFKRCMEVARGRSQAGSGMSKDIFAAPAGAPADAPASGPAGELKLKFAASPTKFEGYVQLNFDGAEVLAIVQDKQLVQSASAGEATVLLDRTPFYAESGGQVGDRGHLIGYSPKGRSRHEVLDTQKLDFLYLHRVKLGGPLRVGEDVDAYVNLEQRLPTLRHHSATHLLHNVLRSVLGTHVEQRGSKVAPDRLRFDFTHFEQIKPEQLAEIERRVNEMVADNFPVLTEELPIAEARERGAMALFGEKYGERVRVVSMGPSVELCGGTHCRGTGQIGYFRIVSESSVATGVRRIEAFAGLAAVDDARRSEDLLGSLALHLKTKKESVFERVAALQQELADLSREQESQRKKAANAAAANLLDQVQVKDVAGARLLAVKVPEADALDLRTTLDGLRKDFKEGAVVLAGTKDGKVALLASFTLEIIRRGGHAGNLLKDLAAKVGGKGGGKPEMAQGGGPDAAKLDEALAAVPQMLAGMLK